MQLQGVGSNVVVSFVRLLKYNPFLGSYVKQTLIYCLASSIALCPWKLRNPAGLLRALTEETKGVRLHALQRAHAVLASMVRFAYWAVMVCPGFSGSGYSQISSLTLRNSDWREEHAYSHQSLLRLMRQISQPPEAVENTPSSCLRLLAVSLALAQLQQTSRPMYYWQAVMVQLMANASPSQMQGVPPSGLWVQAHLGDMATRRRAKMMVEYKQLLYINISLQDY